MPKIDPAWLSVLSEWFINFSVFWFGLAFVSPIFPGINSYSKPILLTCDIFSGTISLYLAYWFRKKGKAL